MRRAFGIEFKRGFYSAGFYVSILLIAAAGVIGAGNMLEYIGSGIMPEGEIRFIAAAYYALYSEALCFIIPVACTLAMSASYLEDLQSGMIYYIMLRTTKRRYRLSKVWNCTLFGGLVTFFAFLLLLVVFFIMFPVNSLEITYLKTQDEQYYLHLLQRVVILMLNGSFYALLGGAIAAFTNNKYMAYAAPFIFYYVITTLLQAYLADLYLINPREWLMVQYSKVGVVAAILVFANVLVTICYSKIIGRRWKND